MRDSERKGLSLGQVKAGLTLLSWWLVLLVIPVSSRVALLVCKYTKINPNFFTSCSLALRLISATLFLFVEPAMYVAGSISFYFACVFDAIDGPVARLTGRTTEFGRYYDHISDLVGDLFILTALAFGRGMLLSPLVFGMVFMHIAESYISYLTNMVFIDKDNKEVEFVENNSLVAIFARYRKFFFERNLKSFFSFPDYTAVTFLIFPILGYPEKGIKIGFIFLLTITLYTILSSFMSIHSNERRFP